MNEIRISRRGGSIAGRRTLAAMVVAILCWAPQVVWAQADEVREEASQEEQRSEDSRNWAVSAELSSLVAQGTFADPANDTSLAGEVGAGKDAYDRANLSLNVEPSYSLGDFTFSVEAGWVQWLTPGGGTGTTPYASNAEDAFEFRMLDTTASASYAGVTIPETGIRVTPTLDLTFPTSKTSQVDSLVMGTALGTTLSRRFFDRLTMALQVRGQKYWHRRTSASVSRSETDVLYRPGGAEDLGPDRVAIGGYNTEFLLSTGGTLQIKIVDRLSATVYYGLNNYWSYNTGETDQFSAEPAQGGRGHSQLAIGQLQLGYSVNKYLRLKGGTLSIQPPKTSDQDSFRFPFWNFEGAAANYSALQFAVEGRY